MSYTSHPGDFWSSLVRKGLAPPVMSALLEGTRGDELLRIVASVYDPVPDVDLEFGHQVFGDEPGAGMDSEQFEAFREVMLAYFSNRPTVLRSQLSSGRVTPAGRRNIERALASRG